MRRVSVLDKTESEDDRFSRIKVMVCEEGKIYEESQQKPVNQT